MKLLKFTLWMAGVVAFHPVTAQDPYFTQPVHAENAHPCYGETVTLSARVDRATYYEFQLLDNGNEWIRLSSGNTDTTESEIRHVFHSVHSSFRVRVLLRNSDSETIGAGYDVEVHRPVFEVHPRDLLQCNGGEVTFQAMSSEAQFYQWESSSDGLHFSPLSVTTKFKDVQTPGLKVTGIINSHHGLTFRCRVTDAYQCEALSNPAVLQVNQLSSAVSPTTSSPFCEGDTARFFPASAVGTILSYQWWIRKAGQTSYSPLEEDERFHGTTTVALKVNGILPEENSYRIRVGFVSLNQQPSGLTDSAVCYLESTRANYIIRPRPASPSPLDSLQSCGPSTFLISGTEIYSWYEDTLTAPVKLNSSFYETPELDSSRVYYYAVRDDKGCESYRLPVSVWVRPIPAQVFSLPEGVCPDETRVPLTANQTKHDPLYWFIESPHFLAVDSLPVHSDIPLPLPKNSDHLVLRIHSKNAYCASDTTELRLEVFPETRIHPTLGDIGVCEGEPVRIQADFTAREPVRITWYRNGNAVGNADTLLISSAQPVHEGTYTVEVEGRCGEEISEPFALSVRPATLILSQPRDTTLCENQDALFRIQATGSGSLNYEWFINGQSVPGNADTLSVRAVTPLLDGAGIFCRVTSTCAREVFSDTAVLRVHPLPPPPAVSDTLLFCTSSDIVRLEEGLHWYDDDGHSLPSPEVKVQAIQDRIFFVSQTDNHGCESPLKPFLTRVHPAFTLKAITDREQLCLNGNFNRSAYLGAFTSTMDSVSFRLVLNGQVMASNSTGNFLIEEPGLYYVEGHQEHCSARDSLHIRAAGPDLAFSPSVADTEACAGTSVEVEASSPYEGGTFYWWTHPENNHAFATGNPVHVSDTVFYVSYGILTDGTFCESPRTKATARKNSPLLPGRITETHLVNCAGYNPQQINSTEAPVNSTHIQWQQTENCENPLWEDIPGATALSYNPGVLQVSTCYRRKVWNACDTLFSNEVHIEISPDPTLTLSANQDTVWAGDTLRLHALLHGGAGTCAILWQVNPVSAAASNPNWTDAGSGPELHYSGHEGPLHFRARVSCDLSSCNLGTSGVLSVHFLQPPVSKPLNILSQTPEMTNCYGSVSSLRVEAEGSGQLRYRWQRRLPGDSVFTDLTENNYLSGIESSTLRIGSTGNAESPHEAAFRCAVSDTSETVFSGEIALTVNRLLGNLPNQTLCAGNDLRADLGTTFSVSGNPLLYAWQHRPGTGHPWVALSDTGQVAGSGTPYLKITDLPELEQVQYRCAVTFSSSHGSCVETTDLMTLKVGGYPEKPSGLHIEICQNEKMEKITLYPPEDLKVNWYRLYQTEVLSRQPDIYTDIPGEYFMQYTYMTPQKCESPRALVRITVHPTPPPPHNSTPEVYDETETLVFSAEGENLRWYRTRTLKSFESYPPVFTSTGKKSYYVTQTSAAGCESERLLIQSEIRPVFRIITPPQDQTNCAGNTVTFGVRVTGGTEVTYQWQREYYGLFADIAGATARDYKISEAGTAPDTDGTRYRCIVRSGQKELISEPVTLRVNRLASSFPVLTLCPGEALDFSRFQDSISGTPLKWEWQLRSGTTYTTVFESSGIAETYLPESGTFRLRVTFPNSGGTCVRNSGAIPVRHFASPPEAPQDTLVQLCLFSPQLNGTGLAKTWWQRPGEEEWQTEPGIPTDEEGEYVLAYKTEGEGGCFSEPGRMTLMVAPCYFAGQKDTAVSLPVPDLHPGEWNYLYLENGEIFAAVHPGENDPGSLLVQFTSTARPVLTDSSGNRFYPRSLALAAARELISPLKIRYYLSLEELQRYPEGAGDALLLLHRPNGSNAGADSTLWLQDTLTWQSMAGGKYLCTEFETVSTGDYFWWKSRVPAGRLRVGTDAQAFPLLLAEHLLPMPEGEYVVRKSPDGISWHDTWRGITAHEKIRDAVPYTPETYYRLEFDFGKHIRAVLDTAKAYFQGEQPLCLLLENPGTEGRNIRLYFPGLQAEYTRLVSLQGREIPLREFAKQGDHHRIIPANPLTPGTYYLTARNPNGQSCIKRIIIY